MYKVYKIHMGVKRMKTEEDIENFTGDLKQDTEIYMEKHKETTLRGIFLKEKITSNTVQKKIKDIILLFMDEDHVKVQEIFEDILKYKLEPVIREQPEIPVKVEDSLMKEDSPKEEDASKTKDISKTVDTSKLESTPNLEKVVKTEIAIGETT
eukprot:CAMPEP_0205802672 /NCGR_PEP_ID=MMETSP0205-20121125/5096_1 /ASSEMBLY_ACC=CAM_ASM_000278 /TAXON_ID=36767 /ORGANISM="Euplotes focardii, Strain TN1" /LENGTH=152 /DNA_ID=CAMNT_0053069525 /DNA_START=295 /DNA_END=750 /DNA_ORIENTATION=+